MSAARGAAADTELRWFDSIPAKSDRSKWCGCAAIYKGRGIRWGRGSFLAILRLIGEKRVSCVGRVSLYGVRAALNRGDFCVVPSVHVVHL